MKKIFYLFISFTCLLCACSDEDNHTEPEKVLNPRFLFSTPVDNATDVMLEQEVVVVYNTPLVVDEKIPIQVNGQNATITISGRKLIFALTLAKNSTYKIEIPEGAIKNTVNIPAPALSITFSTVVDTKRYEAEHATLTGDAAIENSLPNHSGTGYANQKNGDIVFKVLVPESGLYKINLVFSNGNNEKENDLEVNGKKLSTLKFAATQDWKTISINKINLNKGENTIAIRKNWGWMYVDYIEVGKSSEEVPFNLSANLVTANPSKEAVNVYNFLKENFEKKVISGAMANYNIGLEEATWMRDQTGKWPALTGFDYIDYTRDWDWISKTALTNNAKDWWANNGLLTVMWHWRDPSRKTDAFYTKDTSFDISKIADTNSDEYKAIIADIDIIASYLKQLKEANIPVLWRPLHEAAGGWFWWGAKGAQPCKDLWKLMYERLVNHHGLNNLIWIWTTDSAANALDWYPGDNYVDILGMDIYPGENQHGSQYISFDAVKEIFGGKKIITLSECGSIPNIEAMLEYGDKWSWFMPWNGEFTRSDNHNGANYLKNLFENENVITRDKMPSLK